MNTVEALRLANFRCLLDTNLIEMRPLTFLVGVNSSGKSSFLRSLPLLRQSVEARTSGPILWYGHYVDFGNFDETISAGADPKEITFQFSTKLGGQKVRSQIHPYYYRRYVDYPNIIDDTNATFLLSVNQPVEGQTSTRRFAITLGNDKIELDIESNGVVPSIRVNGQTMANSEAKFHLEPEGKFFQGISRDDPNEEQEVNWVPGFAENPIRRGYFANQLLDLITPFCSKSTTQTSKLRLIASLPLGSRDQMLHALRNAPRGTKYWKKHISELGIDSADFLKIHCLLIASQISSCLSAADTIVTSFAKEIRYIAPVRATVERYYRAQGLATDEIDPQGKNLAMYLQNLTYSQRQDFSKWTEEQIGFSVKVDSAGDHLQLRLQQTGSSQEYNMTDMGFGFSQVLPILAQIWSTSLQHPTSQRERIFYNPTRVVAIEQPELHLHPRLQAKVADLFASSVTQAKTSDTKLGIIAETHSEAMINRLGQLIINGKLDPADVQIVVFDKPDPESKTRASVATFTANGELKDWPLGFFLADSE